MPIIIEGIRRIPEQIQRQNLSKNRMMKKTFFFTVLLLLAASSFAQEDMQNRYIFIEGTASDQDHLEFFLQNLTMEATGAGYIVTEKKSDAANTLKFKIFSDNDPNEFIINISLLRNNDDFELINFDFFFSSLQDMYTFNRTLFLNATVSIPLPQVTEEYLASTRELNNRWQNKWLYVRASFDYPITFYMLKGDGLYKGVSLYSGTSENPTSVGPLDHKILAMPGATVGAEGQFLNFMSAEVNYQVSMGDTRDNFFINMAAGAELKFPIKFENIMLTPYAAFVYHLTVSPIFSDFPPFAAGGGIEACVKGGSLGAFFIDINYMFSFSDAVMKNPYLAYPEANQLHPKPAVIHYNRSVLGIGIGYKFGFFDRVKK